MYNNRVVLIIILTLFSAWGICSIAMENTSVRSGSPGFELTRAESDFIWHASHDEIEQVKALVPEIENINIKNKKGSTALHWAASKGHFRIVNFLLSSGAQVDVRDRERKTPLQRAAGGGHTDSANLLLLYNADPDLPDEKGDTPLHWSTFNFHNTIVEKLISYKAEINCQNNEGISPLNTSLIVGNLQATQLLLDQKAEFLSDKQKRNPIHCAVWGANYDCLNAVLKALSPEEKLACINGQDRDGETPLHHSAQGADGKIASLLIKHGARINMKCYHKERTPLHVGLRNHKGSVIHAESIGQYMQKQRNRLSTAQLLTFIAALKTAPDLDTNALDHQGWSVHDCIERTRFDTPQERDALMDALFAPSKPKSF